MTAFTVLVISLVCGLLPGFAWLAFYLGDDDHPEPKRLIIFTFIAGMAFGFAAAALENVFSAAFAQWGVAILSVGALLVFALTEEVAKFAAAHFAAAKSPDFNHPIDGMIFMIVAALGFATIENIGALSNIPLNSLFVPALFETVSFRFVGATLLHTLTSGIVGFHWAMGIKKNKEIPWVAGGIAIATVLHATFNYLILNYGNGVYTVVFVLIVGLFVLNDFEHLKTAPVPAVVQK